MASQTNIRIDGVEYRHLGNNQLQNVQTNKKIDAAKLSTSRNIYLGSYNDQRGLNINSHTVSLSLCSNLSAKTWSNITKLALLFACGLLLTGMTMITLDLIPLAASITFIIMGILGIVSASLKLYRPVT